MKENFNRQTYFILPPSSFSLTLGAGDETRTRDPQLGRLMLYQLSYTRPSFPIANFQLPIRTLNRERYSIGNRQLKIGNPFGAGGRIRTYVGR